MSKITQSKKPPKTIQKELENFRDTIVRQNKVADVEFAHSIIKTFSEIWQLWIEYPVFKSSFKSENFLDVYVDLASYFKNYENYDSCDSETEYMGICDLCDVEIPLKNNDINFSMKLHEQSPSHVEVVKNFREIAELSVDNELKTERDEANGIDNVKLQNNKSQIAGISCQFIENGTDGTNRAYCSACKCHFPSTLHQLILHKNDRNHQLMVKKLNIKESNALKHKRAVSPSVSLEKILKENFIGESVDMANRKYCSACKCPVPASQFNVVQHVNGANHRLMVTQLNMEKLNIDKNGQCTSQSPKASTKSKNIKDYPFIVTVNEKIRFCALCSCDIPANKSTLNGHVIGRDHQKYLRQMKH